jgi:hypothetical protein
MLHKTQSLCSPNVILAYVLNDSYMHTTYFSKKIKYRILRYTRSKVKFEDPENTTVLNILV